VALLEVRDLKTYFRTAGEPCRVADGVSLTVESAETVGLVGESGCGKSLTALSVMQLIPAPGYVAGGSILFKGRDVVRLPGPEKRTIRGRHMAMIFQEPMTSLNPVLSIRTQLLEAIRHGRPADGGHRSCADEVEQAVEALRLTDMPEPRQKLTQYPHQLSGGMRQRVMIAMALACRPELLIADEPTTALDVTVEARILDLLRDLQGKLGTAILFITHDLAVVAEMARRVAVMYAGKIVETAPTAVLFAEAAHPYSGWTTSRFARIAPSSGIWSSAPSATCSWPSSARGTGGKKPDLTVAQVHAATAALVPIWTRGGRCSRARAEAISRRLLLTQQRNARAARCHRWRTLRRLHEKGVFLKDTIICQPRRL